MILTIPDWNPQILDTKGPNWTTRAGKEEKSYRTLPLPFSKKLAKKKKYKKSRHLKTSKMRTFMPVMKNVNHKYHLQHYGTAKMGNIYQDNFYDLCKNGDSQWRKPEFNSHLKCHHLNLGNPYMRLGPFKMEEKSDKPFLVIFHDFLSKRETSTMTSMKSDKLFRSQLADLREKKKKSKIRTSKQIWVKDFPESVFADQEDPNRLVRDSGILSTGQKVSRRVEHATKLNLLKPHSAEPYQGTILHAKIHHPFPKNKAKRTCSNLSAKYKSDLPFFWRN